MKIKHINIMKPKELHKGNHLFVNGHPCMITNLIKNKDGSEDIEVKEVKGGF